MRPPPFDPYHALGLTPAATDVELAAARKALSARHHPDRDRTPGAAARFVEIQQAYALLADPARRRAYDEHVGRQRRARDAEAERAQQERAEADERARRERQERAQAGEDLAERMRRAEAQRERARREQEERAAQLRRILERARQAPNPVASDDVDELRDPTPGGPADHARAGAPVDRAADDEPAEASLRRATPDAEVARHVAFSTSVGLAGVAAAAAGLWIVGGAAAGAGAGFLLHGSFYLALLGAVFAVPAAFALAFAAILGITYPLARPAAAVANLCGSRPAARSAGAARSLLEPFRRAARRRWIYAASVAGCLVAACLILRWSWGLNDRPLEERQVLVPLVPLALACDLMLFYVARVWRALGVRNGREAALRWRPDDEVEPSHDDDEPPPRRRRGTFSTVAAVPSPAAAAAASR